MPLLVQKMNFFGSFGVFSVSTIFSIWENFRLIFWLWNAFISFLFTFLLSSPCNVFYRRSLVRMSRFRATSEKWLEQDVKLFQHLVITFEQNHAFTKTFLTFKIFGNDEFLWLELYCREGQIGTEIWSPAELQTMEILIEVIYPSTASGAA